MATCPVPKPPPAVVQNYPVYKIDTPGWWLVLSDVHIPYHDVAALEAAVAEGKRNGCVGVLLNGDILDCHELSFFDQDPKAPRYTEELELGEQFLGWLRGEFPTARFVWKDGNHEERLERYLMRKAPALFGHPMINLPSFLGLEKAGIAYVGEKRVIRMGKLNVLHGHEYSGPHVATPVNPARGIYLRAKGNALCGHWHQTSEHHEQTIDFRRQGCWSTGALCQLFPYWNRLNKWNTGFAMVKLDKGGLFQVRNMRVMGGEVV